MNTKLPFDTIEVLIAKKIQEIIRPAGYEVTYCEKFNNFHIYRDFSYQGEFEFQVIQHIQHLSFSLSINGFSFTPVRVSFGKNNPNGGERLLAFFESLESNLTALNP